MLGMLLGVLSILPMSSPEWPLQPAAPGRYGRQNEIQWEWVNELVCLCDKSEHYLESTGHTHTPATIATRLTDMQNNARNWLFHNWICQSVCFWCLYVNGDGGGGGAASAVTPPTLFSRTKTGHTSEVYIFRTMWFFILCATPRA